MAKKELTIALKAIDEASGVFKKFEANAKGVVQRSALTRPLDLAPVRKVQRTQEEQMIRDEQAAIVRRLRAGEQVGRQERARQIAEERIFGKQIAQAKGEAVVQETIRQNRRREAVEQSFLKRTQGMLGRGSTFKETAELFMGGGAIIGASMVLRAIADATAKAKELSLAYRDGSKNAGDITDELAAQIPILGHSYRATKDIVEILTGEEAILKRIADHHAFINEAIGRRATMESQSKNAQKTLAEIAEEARRNVAERADPTGQTGLFFNRADAIRRAKEIAEISGKAVRDEAKAARGEAEKELARIRGENKAIADSMNGRLIPTDEELERIQRSGQDQLAAGQRIRIANEVEKRELEKIKQAEADALLAIQHDYADQSLRRQKELEEERRATSDKAKFDELEAIRANAQKENEARAEQIRLASQPNRITMTGQRREVDTSPARSAPADEARFLVGITSGAERYQQQSLRKQDRVITLLEKQIATLISLATKNPLSTAGGLPIFN